MNFYDFLIFLTHIGFANLIQLCYLLRDGESLTWNSFPITHQLTSNLASIQKIALKMKSIEGLTRNHGFHLDFSKTLDNPEFVEICMVLEKTYGMIYNQQTSDYYHSMKSVVDDTRDLDIMRRPSSSVSNPEDLVTFIDHVITNICGVNGEENVLLSKPS